MLKQRVILEYVTKVFLQVFTIISGIIVAKIAGPVILGTLMFSLSFVYTFTFISDFGLTIAHVKLVSSGEDFGKCNTTFAILKSFATGFFVFFVLAVFLSQKYIFHIKFESKAHEFVIFIWVFILAIHSLSQIAISTFSARLKTVKVNAPLLIRSILANSLKIIVAMLGFGAIAISFSSLFAAILSGIAAFFFLKSYPFSVFDKDLAIRYFKISFPILGTVIMLTILTWTDKVILQYFAGSKEVGFYAAGFKVGSLIKLIGTSFATLFFPIASTALSKRDIFVIKDKLYKFERFSYIFIMPVVCFIAIYSEVIVKIILGNEYITSASVVSIISLAMFLYIVGIPYWSLLFSGGFLKCTTIVFFIELILFISLEYLFVSHKFLGLGANGAALAVFISNLFLFIAFKAQTAKRFKDVDVKLNNKYILYGVVNLIVFYLLFRYFVPIYGVIFKSIFPFIYFITTYVSLHMMGYITREDKRRLKSIVDFSSLRNYIKEDIGTL